MAKSVAFHSTPALKIIKFFVVTSLSSAYIAYIYNAWLKYDKGQVGTSTSMEHKSQFNLPDISICSILPHNVSKAMEDEGREMIVNILNMEQFFRIL